MNSPPLEFTVQIITRLDSLRRREHGATVALIEALVECQRTRAYADAGYDSVWKLLVERLGYSPAAASRRVAAMRCVMKCPRSLDMLRERRTTLSALHLIAKTLAEADDPDAMLNAIDGASQVDVERVVARRRPVAKPVERVRRKFVTNTKPVPAPGRSASESSASELPLEIATATPEAPTEERVQLTLSLTAADYERLEAAKKRLSGKYPKGMTLEELFLELMTSFEARKPPRAKPARASTSDAKAASSTSDAEPRPRSRHIPDATRRQVFERDDARCTYVAPDGTKCTSEHDLELDHVIPWARGGTHDPTNLRVLCTTHNRRRAEREFGRVT